MHNHCKDAFTTVRPGFILLGNCFPPQLQLSIGTCSLKVHAPIYRVIGEFKKFFFSFLCLSGDFSYTQGHKA